ncbi:metallophosphoesterase family protein [Alkalicoccus urumqiensis]|uniref:Phosphoesterase n=1 Tax=Alkalicoccus urumqiensis TaxID=1548213 RepID=A0A2P6MEZ4_ALKUR|nr:YfcE family phosphodiesterase [Alkalicoccus urumqiensis]PRO64817.1 YfcE family phosphodiesterase [Alkalicoccus urumqiensis]
MKLFVLGDTHRSDAKPYLPESFLNKMKSADIVIHTGDWCSLKTMGQLEDLRLPVFSVYGNADDSILQEKLPATRLETVSGWNIGIVHGHEGTGRSTEERVRTSFSTPPDLVFFGHSHIPYLRWHHSCCYMNPGSFYYRRKVPYCSYLEVDLQTTGFQTHFHHFSWTHG